MITASAPIDPEVMRFLKVCFCCPFIEGYGLTETSGGASTSAMDDPVLGHVGGPLKCFKWRFMDIPEMNYTTQDKPYPRGELLMKGPSIFKGYFKKPDITAECFDKEGWFKTGDIVCIYPNGSVKIIDRSKNIFKLSQGEYIAPEKLENKFVLSAKIAQNCVYGDSLRSCTIAIIVPDEEWLKNWAQQHNKSTADCFKDPAFKKEIMDEILQLSKEHKLSGLERPKDIILASDPFSIDNDLLTPTFKLKRNKVRDAYRQQIDAMYEELKKREN